jgi:PPOX class probable FMN-dependent enzyme
MPDALSPFSPALLNAAEALALIGSYSAVSPGAAGKDIGRIDSHMRRFIGMAPICFLATADATGKADVSPRGDPPGSFKVLDEHTVAVADRPGNNRLDTLRNIVENPEIGVLFLVPGVNETVRLAGTAGLSLDPTLLESMAVQGKPSKCAIVVKVRQAYLHCAKAMLRSRLWTGDYVQPKGTFPSISRMIGDQLGYSEEEKRKREAITERAYREGLWEPVKP